MTHDFSGTARAIPLSSADDRQSAPWWVVFRDLREARTALGLKARHLTTLAALLSFLKPGGPLVVFAGNRSILDRLNGLCERSLQRHVHDLESAGILRRQDSANRKRFRLHGGAAGVQTYGLDLAPLLAMADRIAALAEAARAAAQEARLLRQLVLDRLAQVGPELDPATDHHIRLRLRRAQPAAILRSILADLPAPVAPREADTSADLSGGDRQSVGQYQRSEYQEVSDEGDGPVTPVPPEPAELLRTIATNCPDVRQLVDGGLSHWPTLLAQMRRLAGWIGIAEPLYNAAEARLGREGAAATLCGVVQISARLRQPAAYFQSLTTGRRATGFDPLRMLRQLGRAPHVIRG